MLSKEDSRRLAQLERQLWRDDPDFCARLAGGRPLRRRLPLPLMLVTGLIWAIALIFAVTGWWIPALVAGLWATVIVVVTAHRTRPRQVSRW